MVLYMKYWLLLLLTALMSCFSNAAEQESESYADKVVVLKVGEKSLMNKHSFKYWRKVLKRADAEKARAVVFEIETPGGYAMETADLITRVMPDLTVPTIAFVNRNATSAGSMIAFGCDKIYMHPRGTIGSTGIVSGAGEIDPVMRAKMESLFQSYVKIVAKEKGRNADVMKAMMFREHEYSFADGEVVVPKGELLNLIADEAVLLEDGKPLLANGICENIDEILALEQMTDAVVVNADPKGLDAFASWVGLISPLLISVGLIALFMELKAPGFGIFGLVGLLAFALFFVGNNLDGNMSGGGLFLLFLGGLILLILEFWVIPGTFVAGAVGLVMVLSALVLAMVDVDMFDSFSDSKNGLIGLHALIIRPIQYLAIGLVISVFGCALAMRFLPSLPMYNSIAISEALELGTGLDKGAVDLEGAEGVVTCELRPAGKILVKDVEYQVVSDGHFIAVGERVRVISADGMRILVHPIVLSDVG